MTAAVPRKCSPRNAQEVFCWDLQWPELSHDAEKLEKWGKGGHNWLRLIMVHSLGLVTQPGFSNDKDEKGDSYEYPISP